VKARFGLQGQDGAQAMMAAGNNCRLLAFYFSVQIWYMFFISKYRGESEFVLQSEVGTAQPHSLCKSQTHAQTLSSTFRSILGTCSKFEWKNKMLALSPQF